MANFNTPYAETYFENLNETQAQGTFNYRINNVPYMYYVYLVNGNGNYVQLNPESIVNLSINDNILDYSQTGTALIRDDNEVLQRSSFTKLLTYLGEDISSDAVDLDLTDFFFRNDCRDFLYIYIKPDLSSYDEEVKMFNDSQITLRGIFSIVKNEEVTGTGNNTKLKKLDFIDSSVEYLREKNISFSTANFTNSNNIDDLDDSNREMFTGLAIREIIIEGLAMGSKGENQPLNGNVISDNWEIGTTKIFYSSPGESNAIEDLEYILQRHTSSQPPFDFCLLRQDRFTKEWSLYSMKSLYENAIAQNETGASGGIMHTETFVLGTTSDTKEEIDNKRQKTPGLPENNFTLPDYSYVDDYTFFDMYGLTSQRDLVTTAVHSYQLNDKQFQIDLTNNNIETCYDAYYDAYVRGEKEYPLFVAADKENIFSNLFLNTLRKFNVNFKNDFSINDKEPDQRLGQGRNKVLRDMIFKNNAIELSVAGLTFREASKFFSFDKPNNFLEGRVDDKIFGTYLAVNVSHNFVGESYSNKIIGVKTYLYDNPFIQEVL